MRSSSRCCQIKARPDTVPQKHSLDPSSSRPSLRPLFSQIIQLSRIVKPVEEDISSKINHASRFPVETEHAMFHLIRFYLYAKYLFSRIIVENTKPIERRHFERKLIISLLQNTYLHGLSLKILSLYQ